MVGVVADNGVVPARNGRHVVHHEVRHRPTILHNRDFEPVFLGQRDGETAPPRHNLTCSVNISLPPYAEFAAWLFVSTIGMSTMLVGSSGGRSSITVMTNPCQHLAPAKSLMKWLGEPRSALCLQPPSLGCSLTPKVVDISEPDSNSVNAAVIRHQQHDAAMHVSPLP